MTTRIRRTAEQIANDLEARARIARTKAKNMERAKQTRTAIIAGETIRGFVNSGDADAKRVWDRMLASLTRKQDRLAFDMVPLPEPGPVAVPPAQPAANPPAADLIAAAVTRRTEAVKAWDFVKTEANRIAVGQAIAACEVLTGKCWENLPLEQRRGWGLGDRPGELLQAS